MNHVPVAGRLSAEHVVCHVEDFFYLLFRRPSVGGEFGDVRRHLLFQAADSLAEELVHVRREDCEKLHALQQRVAFVHRLVEHPLLEFELAQFPIEVVLRVAEVDIRAFGTRFLVAVVR